MSAIKQRVLHKQLKWIAYCVSATMWLMRTSNNLNSLLSLRRMQKSRPTPFHLLEDHVKTSEGYRVKPPPTHSLCRYE